MGGLRSLFLGYLTRNLTYLSCLLAGPQENKGLDKMRDYHLFVKTNINLKTK